MTSTIAPYANLDDALTDMDDRTRTAIAKLTDDHAIWVRDPYASEHVMGLVDPAQLLNPVDPPVAYVVVYVEQRDFEVNDEAIARRLAA